ncbi:MAG TPA: carotenoid 1,2-hydratase, partial [Labilithrix sp.]|nr:carotenoid 1,2-hydratase [Labilithrix sp.]
MSDDGESSIVLIALLGNVFSPRWARARRRDPAASSLDFSALNVAIRSGNKGRWALTERGRRAVERSADHLTIGASTLAWRGDELTVEIDERSAPWGSPLRGKIRLVPLAASPAEFALDPRGVHTWSPRIPVARIEVDFEEPRIRFHGTGYLDLNRGDGPLEETFASWSWSRVSAGDRVAIAYDVTLRDGLGRGGSFGSEQGRAVVPIGSSALVELAPTRFGLPRTARGEQGAPVDLVRTLEDGPFYARSVVKTTLGGRAALGMHETVSLDRFRAAWVRFLVPFRMR